jgi:hypothetical protein
VDMSILFKDDINFVPGVDPRWDFITNRAIT